MKAKTHAVKLCGLTFLVHAITKAGAIRDLMEHLRDQASADLATGEQIYLAGAIGQEIIGIDRYKNSVDPNQPGLTGIPETADPINQADEE